MSLAKQRWTWTISAPLWLNGHHQDMKLMNSLTNMFGEFVATQKSPEFNLSSASMQELNKAVKEEKKCYAKIVHLRPRPRCMSTGNIYQEVSRNPSGGSEVTMREHNCKRRERPTSLIERVRQRISPDRRDESIAEEEEGEGQVVRKTSTVSERLHIIVS
ncbi:unnamed protein product [Cylicocyclus nassatus]|uniref:Uncharacterized protein n=1 Tax=Cylicocyclus nassatus TaxID=53992 RepID=A0AA36GEL6_CYLNA|nr:unnamed protein product [Cylicocyclus nassatus]